MLCSDVSVRGRPGRPNPHRVIELHGTGHRKQRKARLAEVNSAARLEAADFQVGTVQCSCVARAWMTERRLPRGL